MWVKEIWRYPVKSMAGEMLQTAELGSAGIEGDRLLQVRNAAGRVMTARTRPLLLRHSARFNGGDVLVDGQPWNSPGIARAVVEAAGPSARLVAAGKDERFDILPLLVATDGMLEAVGYDRRRFRPNFVIGGVEGRAERQWERKRLRVGDAVVAMEDLRSRCIMTTFDPDTGEQDAGVLRKVQQQFDGRLGLNAYVVSPGRVSVGDAVDWIAD